MTTHFFGDTAVLLGRSLRHITRSPDTIITTAIMPIALLLLFVYVLGGAIKHGPETYVTYLLPGILLITIASGISYTALRLFTDMQGGIFQRFQSMPIARSSVLWSHVLTSLAANLISLVLVVLIAVAMGFRSGAGAPAWLAVAGILFLFTLALTWIAVIPGLSAKSVDGAAAFAYPLIFLPFISSAFVPTATMPGPVRAFAGNRSSWYTPCSAGARAAAELVAQPLPVTGVPGQGRRGPRDRRLTPQQFGQDLLVPRAPLDQLAQRPCGLGPPPQPGQRQRPGPQQRPVRRNPRCTQRGQRVAVLGLPARRAVTQREPGLGMPERRQVVTGPGPLLALGRAKQHRGGIDLVLAQRQAVSARRADDDPGTEPGPGP